ncbi:MAG: DEAD/DEAH box helicase family protein, partial [Acidimicrobiales bacterium]|nr:DEAD/DEAH box helicase family protein [Acidimicrobiales bacterium]
LDRATTYDRAVGYFRSSVFHLTQVAMSDFALRGGRMRLICSPHLDENDAKVMQRAFGQAEELIVASIGHDIEKALQDVAEHASLQMLATLLEFGILEIRLTYKPKQTGIFHTKIGIISDGTDSLSFDGSANETFMAWSENEERVTPFCSWRDDYQHRQVQWDTDYFEDLWESKKAGLKTQALPEVVFEDLRQYAVPDPQEAIEQVRLAQLGQSQRSSTASKGTRKTPMRHQAQVRDNWLKEMRGIICFVTGGGKTVAALEIINEWIIRHPKGSVIVLVPSNLLAKQWRKELAQLDSYLNILQVGGDDAHANWRERLSDYTRETPAATRPRVVLAVMKSAASADFLRLAQVGDHTLLVADEVHTVGAKQLRMALTLETGGRLGLSATPERFGDEEGTAVIFDYFGDKLEPEYTIRDAQQGENPRLVPYVYEPDVLFLTPSEYDKYEKESQLIKRLAGQAASSGSAGDEEKLLIARIRRARILKTASAKPSLAVKVIQEEFRDGDRWLVYCDDGRQLEEVKRLLKEALIDSGVMPLEYTSAMIFDPDAT